VKDIVLRKHQAELKNFIDTAEKMPIDILMNVTPGGGKSMLPGIIAEKFKDFRIAWFVPRLSLRRQAAIGLMESFGIEVFEPDGSVTNPARGTRGFAATHQTLCQNVKLWRDELKRHPYILVIDELHHAKVTRKGEKNKLAEAIDQLEYKIRLCMTGTMETNDNTFIHTVPYKMDDTGYVIDFAELNTPQRKYIEYSRSEALREKAVTTVEFHYHDGPVKWENRKGIQETILSQADPDIESQALMTALNRDLADQLFENCCNHWGKTGKPGDRLLIVTADQKAAKEYYELLKRIEPRTSLAISDAESPSDEIVDFQDGRTKCLVTCMMAYEGLDVPEITHIACLTHIRSVPWIIQMLGRAWRRKGHKQKCHVFIPDDPAINRVIDRVRLEDIEAISFLNEKAKSERPIGQESQVFIPIAGKVSDVRSCYLDDGHIEDEAQAEIAAICDKFGISPNCDAAVALLEKIRIERMDVENYSPPRTLTPAENMKRIRRDISQSCNAADFRNNVKPGTHQGELFKRTGKSITAMTLKELENARRVAIQICS
jgi:superfamily II DNA or RNA helicase